MPDTMLETVPHCRLEATIAALRYWAPSVADVACVKELDGESCWTITVLPLNPASCPFELSLRHDGHYRLELAGEVYDNLPIESFELFVPLAEAIASGNVYRRFYESRLTGLLRGLGTVVELADGRVWSAERQVPGLPPADPDDVIATDHYFAPYRR